MKDMQTLNSLAISHEKILVCGCGQSINQLPPNLDLPTIGVNYINKYMPVDYLVCVNEVPTFSNDNFTFIESTSAKLVFSQLDLPIFNKKKLVHFDLGTREEINLDKDKIDFSVDSTYISIILAYKMGAKEIGLIGCDLIGHTLFKRLEQINTAYTNLYNKLQEKGVNLWNLSKNSLVTTIPKKDLSEFLKITRNNS
jgi:hypothetical protein